MQQTGYFWHVYPNVLLEWCYSYDENKAYIMKEKPPEEHELRLRLMQPVKNVEVMKTYNEAVASAQKAFDEAIRPAGEVYYKAVDPIWKDYKNGVVTTRGAYDEATTHARKTFEEAILPVLQIYNDSIAEAMIPVIALHEQECPNCPWDGETIFPEK